MDGFRAISSAWGCTGWHPCPNGSEIDAAGGCAAICWCALRKPGLVAASCVSAKKHITLSRPGCRYIQRGIFSPREIPGGEGAPDRLGPSRGVWPQVATVWRTA
jgi:hypothetical protein